MIIHKYKVPSPICTMDLPAKGRFLSVGMQGDEIVLWYLDGEFGTLKSQILCFNTGQALPDDVMSYVYLGTVTSSNGIVWHVFEGYLV